MPTGVLNESLHDLLDEAGRASLRRLKLVTITLAVAGALLLPLMRAYFGMASIQQGLDIEVNQLADDLSTRASTHPDLWLFERNSLDAILAAAIRRGRLEAADLTDAKGVMLTRQGKQVDWLMMHGSANVLDSGVAVAHVRVYASTRSYLVSVAALALLGALAGAAFYFIITRITYQSLSRSMRDLQKARQDAVTAGRARTTFLATMSHEIRTPMNGVIGMTSLLLETPLTAKQREYAETIRVSGDALITVINDILEFSKVDSGTVEIVSRPFAPDLLAEEVLALLAPVAAKKQIELACEFDENLPSMVSADATRLRQILLNLVGNAIKFTGHGEVIVHVSAPGNGQLRYSVRDTGIGMTPEEIQRIFAPFVQADASTTRRYGGTGLGLAISKRIAAAMGGVITVESIAGNGSIFTLDIAAPAVTAPVPDANDVDANFAATTSAEAIEKAHALTGKTILIVDDNATNRAILVTLCRRWGMKTVVFDSSPRAYSWMCTDATAAGIDVAALDYHMPDMDGVELAQRIAARYPQLPMLMLSSLGEPETEMRNLFFAHLEKPVRRAALLNTIYEVLMRPAAHPGTAIAASPVPDSHTQRAQASAALPAADTQTRNSHLQILLVEDNSVNATVVKAMIQGGGHECLWVSGGQASIDVLADPRAQQFDLIFMDMLMPDMDGLEATRRIRQMDLPYRPHIAALTANVMAEDRAACIAAGMDDFLTKPVLMPVLRAFLDARVAVKMRSAHIADDVRGD